MGKQHELCTFGRKPPFPTPLIFLSFLLFWNRHNARRFLAFPLNFFLPLPCMPFVLERSIHQKNMDLVPNPPFRGGGACEGENQRLSLMQELFSSSFPLPVILAECLLSLNTRTSVTPKQSWLFFFLKKNHPCKQIIRVVLTCPHVVSLSLSINEVNREIAAQELTQNRSTHDHLASPVERPRYIQNCAKMPKSNNNVPPLPSNQLVLTRIYRPYASLHWPGMHPDVAAVARTRSTSTSAVRRAQAGS